MRLFQRANLARIPGPDAIVHALLQLRIQPTDPQTISADTPIPVDFDDSTELTVSRRMEIMVNGTNRQIGPERLMSVGILIHEELGFTQRTLQTGKEMRNCLGIIPDMRAGAVAASPTVTAAFPNPESAIVLTHHRGRLENGQIRSYSLHNLLGQVRIVESLRKAGVLCLS